MTSQVELTTIARFRASGNGVCAMGRRSELRQRRRSDAVETKAQNEIVKTKERTRRDARMLQMVKMGTPPYTPAVMSWLSRKLDRKASRITPEDIKTLVA